MLLFKRCSVCKNLWAIVRSIIELHAFMIHTPTRVLMTDLTDRCLHWLGLIWYSVSNFCCYLATQYEKCMYHFFQNKTVTSTKSFMTNCCDFVQYICLLSTRCGLKPCMLGVCLVLFIFWKCGAWCWFVSADAGGWSVFAVRPVYCQVCPCEYLPFSWWNLFPVCVV